ncbi:MAG: MFS transporter [Proteobacteria bacterium]|nr:MFS transporter [Pseudomonadota bacterium]
MRIPDFVAFMASRVLSGVATSLLSTQVNWHVYELSGSAFQLGLVGLVQFLPALLLSPVGGVVADSYERRRIAQMSQAVLAIGGLVLWLATSQGLATLPLLYGIVLCTSSATAFENPARAALLPTLLPAALFPAAVTFYAGGQMIAFMSGPALQGIVLAATDLATVYAVHAVLIAGAFTVLSFVRPRPLSGPGRGLSLAAIREGWAYVRGNQVVLGCMTLDMFAVLFGGAKALLPIYAKDILHTGPAGYGLLVASLEIGSVLMWLVLMIAPPLERAGRALLFAVGVFGAATIVFGFSRSYPLSVAAYLVAGMADYVSVVMRSVAVQLSTPNELRGRVSSINMLFIGASNQLGAVESGFVAALTNATFSVVSGGVGCLIVLGIVAVKLPELGEYDLRTARHHEG